MAKQYFRQCQYSEGINLAKKDTNFGESDDCDINCINFSKICDYNRREVLQHNSQMLQMASGNVVCNRQKYFCPTKVPCWQKFITDVTFVHKKKVANSVLLLSTILHFVRQKWLLLERSGFFQQRWLLSQQNCFCQQMLQTAPHMEQPYQLLVTDPRLDSSAPPSSAPTESTRNALDAGRSPHRAPEPLLPLLRS